MVDSARDRGRVFQRRRQEQLFLLSLVQQGRVLSPINAVIASLYQFYLDRVAALGAQLTISDLKPAFMDARERIPGLFRGSMETVASEIVDQNNADLSADLTVPQIRAITGLPIDAYGNVKPRPGNAIRIRNEDTPENEILEAAAPLLVISGDSQLENESPAVAEIAPSGPRIRELTRPEPREQRSEDLRKSFLSPWTVALGGILSGLVSLPAAIVTRNRRGDSPESTARFVRERLGFRVERKPGILETPSVRTGGILRGIELLLRRETLSMSGIDRDNRQNDIPEEIYAGYILHSVFAENTAPDHANRDGWRFYRDNRDGSDLPWSRRLVPPYRINCLCFTQELYEDPTGEENFADWQAWPKFRGARRIRSEDVGASIWDPETGGFRTISAQDVGAQIGRPNAPSLEPRDVQTWAQWFDSQRPGIQENIVGRQRFFGAASRGAGRVKYQDLVNTNGAFLSPRQLLNESEKDRGLRRRLVKRLIDVTHKEHVQAWEGGGGGKWTLSSMDEQAYQRRLKRFLSSREPS